MAEPPPAERSAYLLPLRRQDSEGIDELAAYLSRLRRECDEVLVVDGSPPPVFARHAEALAGIARHLPPDPELAGAMGKVGGVVTGVRASGAELIVIGDDDVRYRPEELRRTLALLADAELVRPQNYFEPLVWHARWDTARSLLNRVSTGDRDFPVGDFPGTLAVRRSAFLQARAYDGDALFENLELMRTIRAAGGRVLTPLDLLVARRPPTTRHFLSQRVRQAYDDFAIPTRMACSLALLPLAALAIARGRRRALATGAALAVALAEAGRRRAGGASRFPLSGSLAAPLWLAERAVCSWLALGARIRGGARYGEGRLSHPATPMRELRRRYAESERARSASESERSSEFSTVLSA
jgi:hypothetical protein